MTVFTIEELINRLVDVKVDVDETLNELQTGYDITRDTVDIAEVELYAAKLEAVRLEVQDLFDIVNGFLDFTGHTHAFVERRDKKPKS